MGTTKPSSAGVYYQGQYWNDLPEVQEYMSQCFTGDKKTWWTQDFKNRFSPGRKQFKKALFLCDGNGWLSREFIDKKIVLEAVAFDWSTDLLQEAEAKKGKRKIQYFQADVNTITFKDAEYDLIVNNAALHHVQYLNRLLHLLSKAIKPDGIFVNFDYVGPQRNQYSRSHWNKILAFNDSLPQQARNDNLQYPHLATMLHTDPTEAIHSDLIISTMKRHFALLEQHDTNGGLAYHLLTHNSKIFAVAPQRRKPIVRRILVADKKLTENNEVPVLFSYFIAGPKFKPPLSADLKMYQDKENAREKWAGFFYNAYSITEFFKVLRFAVGISIAKLAKVFGL
ncbi:MAG: class I SAM-dependent methyltransferase [bacterium]|nr:class I SAM-dependent methyltransferase [bacterium]